ncbi:TRAP transporter small permease subunit [Chromohalobacter japonicus]|uniref:TRAP transporter small permease subunit n=1 Tax=Chromohalobacter japonicus TaxID=223900 RepID=UPI001FF2A94B|nr:TRAP transporter small permease subunit [Chromohalobacter japonicus]MCK0754270.1 TRAP transporter small permease subunit [Chromohalobacter japonicus]
MKLLSRIISAAESISKLFAIIGAALIIPLILSLAYEVFSRYVLREPTAWAYEISYMLMGTVFLFGMAYALKTRQHVNVDVIYSILPKRAKALCDMVGSFILFIALCWLINALFGYVMDTYEYQERSGASGWNPIIWPFRAVWLIGFTLLAMQTFFEVIKSIKIVVSGNSVGEAV